MLPFYTSQGPRTLSRVLKRELNPVFCREQVTILAGSGGVDRTLDVGAVVGKRNLGAATGAVVAGGTGDGGIGAIVRGIAAKIGLYTMTCVATAANGGRFSVVDPDGYRLADALVGVAYVSPQLGFTISDGAADFVVGDKRTVTIAAGDDKVVAVDPVATDGSHLAYGIVGAKVTAPDGVDQPGLLLTNNIAVDAGELIWPDAATDDQKAAWLSQLAAKRVLALAAG